jgi:ubiquinone/menaquinone biosynthesis C-methylase UbiE
MSKQSEINKEAYQTDDAVEKYSHYGLYPNERYLFEKYFPRDQFILDLACGAGRTTLRLTELGYHTKGVDLSEKLIAIAKRRFPNIAFEVGNYCDIHEKDHSVDNILISHNGLDYAHPESQRVKAIGECARVIRRGGMLIISSHNIKSLHASPYFFKERKMWMLKNTLHAFKEKGYIMDLGMYTFYCSPKYCIKQMADHGFKLREVVGFRQSHSDVFIKYVSPYNHYVFQKQ